MVISISDNTPYSIPQEVLSAAARGWRLHPVQPGAKTPLLPRWPEVASADPDQLEAWERLYPRCNWGVVTGSGLVVIDVDGGEGRASVAELERQGYALPPTLCVVTGRADGGGHRYYQAPAGVEVRNDQSGRIGPHIDVRGEGGYVVSPPSVHPSGARYRYVDAAAPVAELPAWVVDRLSTAKPASPTPAQTGAQIVAKGHRTNLLVSLAGTMLRRGMSGAAITAALTAENAARCSPPLHEAKIRSIAADIVRRYPSPSPASTTPGSIGPDVVRLSDVQALPVPWLWRQYLAYGMLSMLSGDPSSGKTFIVLAIAADLSNGRVPVSGEVCELVDTLYLSHENAAEYVIRPRFDAQGGDASRFHLLRGSIAGDGEAAIRAGITLKDVALLDAALVQTGAKLIIIDPIQSYLGAEVDAYRSNETRPVMDGLITLAEKHNVAVLIVRHLSKSSGGRAIHRGLGSIDLTGAVRTEMLAGTAPGEPDNRALVQIKNNLGPQAGSLGYEIVGEEMEARLEWRGNSTLTAADLLAPDAATEGRSDKAEAEDYIREQLANGPKLLRDLKSASGIPEWTLQRAAKSIGITRSRDGERGPWVWALGNIPDS